MRSAWIAAALAMVTAGAAVAAAPALRTPPQPTAGRPAPLVIPPALRRAAPPAPPRPPRPEPIRRRSSVAVGSPAAGRLVRGVQLPAERPSFFTWDPVRRRSP